MKSNTDISLLYYISTTKRITKKDLKRLNIPSLLVDLTKQPFALRLYSYLVVGIIRVYLFKLKVYESEIQTMLNTLQYKRKRESKVSRKRKIEECLLEDEVYEDGVYDEGVCEVHEHKLHDDGILVKRRHKVIVDRVTEYSNCTKFSLSTLHPSVEVQDFVMPPYTVLGLIKAFDVHIPEEMDMDYEPVEKMRGSSGLNYSTTVVEEEMPLDTHRMTGRLGRAMSFYLLLERATKGEIEVYQKEPFSEILVV